MSIVSLIRFWHVRYHSYKKETKLNGINI